MLISDRVMHDYGLFLAIYVKGMHNNIRQLGNNYFSFKYINCRVEQKVNTSHIGRDGQLYFGLLK